MLKLKLDKNLLDLSTPVRLDYSWSDLAEETTCCEHRVIASLKTPLLKKPLNLDKKFVELTIKDGIVKDFKLNCRLLYRNLKYFYMWPLIYC